MIKVTKTAMIDSRRLKKLLQRMIDIYSPSGKEEEIVHFLRSYFKRKGLDAVLQPVDENRHNLIIAPRDAEIQLALIGHLDTVTAYDLDHYTFSEEDGLVHGLGAADMKGGCAAMIEAFLSFHESRKTDPPIALCLVVGEEETGDGAVQLMKSYRFPWALIGEPTNLMPCFQSYGYVECQISAEGRRQHASMAGRRKNAVEALLASLITLTNHMEIQHPELIYNIRDLFTPTAGFAVPEYCEAWMDIHLPPQALIGKIITGIEETIAAPSLDPSGITVRFRTETIDAGYLLPEKGPVKEAVEAAFKAHGLSWETRAFPSHSDANHVFSSGTRPIILGPGQLEKAHAQDESVPFAQIVKAAEIYHDTMAGLIMGPGKNDEGTDPSLVSQHL